MPKHFKLFLLFCVLASLSEFHARSPAVQPVTGISIDDYIETDPAKDPGFNFNQNAKTKRAPGQANSPSIIEGRSILTKSSPESSSSIPGYLLIALLASLPFALWWGVIKALDFETKTQVASENHGAIDLQAEREKRSSQTEQESINKAS